MRVIYFVQYSQICLNDICLFVSQVMLQGNLCYDMFAGEMTFLHIKQVEWSTQLRPRKNKQPNKKTETAFKMIWLTTRKQIITADARNNHDTKPRCYSEHTPMHVWVCLKVFVMHYFSKKCKWGFQNYLSEWTALVDEGEWPTYSAPPEYSVTPLHKTINLLTNNISFHFEV